jgi:integrase
MHPDGKGLYLQVREGSAGLSKAWIFRYAAPGTGRERYMGLGSYPNVSLAAARARAAEARRLRVQHIDPITDRDEQRNALRRAEAEEKAKLVTFRECAERYIDAHAATWENPKHRAQWLMTLLGWTADGKKTKHDYCALLHGMPVAAIDTGTVIRVLEPIWSKKPETASRIRGRIETVLDWAKVREYRQGENPARWRGHLDQVLPARSKVRRVRPHPALPYIQVNGFMTDLEARAGIAAKALQFTILCAVRTGDVIGNDREDKPPIKWTHVELGQHVWIIPSTKTSTEHRVPLTERALKLLKELMTLELSEVVFPGAAGGPLSNMSMASVIDRMNADRTARGLVRYVDPKQSNRDVTVHGFRSTFRTWAAERTNFPREVVEAALAHVVGDDTERAYQRGDLFEKRRRLMAAWADYCSKSAENVVVVPIRQVS